MLAQRWKVNLIISIPGEYENLIFVLAVLKHIMISNKARTGQNTIFKIGMDDISILHCGDLGHTLE